MAFSFISNISAFNDQRFTIMEAKKNLLKYYKPNRYRENVLERNMK